MVTKTRGIGRGRGYWEASYLPSTSSEESEDSMPLLEVLNITSKYHCGARYLGCMKHEVFICRGKCRVKRSILLWNMRARCSRVTNSHVSSYSFLLVGRAVLAHPTLGQVYMPGLQARGSEVFYSHVSSCSFL